MNNINQNTSLPPSALSRSNSQGDWQAGRRALEVTGEDARSIRPRSNSSDTPKGEALPEVMAIFKLCHKCNKEFEVVTCRLNNGFTASFQSCPHCGVRNDTWLHIPVNAERHRTCNKDSIPATPAPQPVGLEQKMEGTPTPRTDDQFMAADLYPPSSEVVRADFARALERSLNEANERYETAQLFKEDGDKTIYAQLKTIQALQQQVEALTKELNDQRSSTRQAIEHGDEMQQYWHGKLCVAAEKLFTSETSLATATRQNEELKREKAELEEDMEGIEERLKELYWRKQYEEACIKISDQHDKLTAALSLVEQMKGEHQALLLTIAAFPPGRQSK